MKAIDKIYVFKIIGTVPHVVQLYHKSFRSVNVLGVAQYVIIGYIHVRVGMTFMSKNIVAL